MCHVEVFVLDNFRKGLTRFVLAGTLTAPALAQVSDEIPFRKHTLDLGRNETCAFADLNGDGHTDLIAGESWYEGPTWTKHRFRSFNFFNNYIDNFSDLPIDVNGDGATDIVSVSWGSKRIAWFENPGKGIGDWKEHLIDQGANVEFAFLVDMDNDGKARELLPQMAGPNGVTAWYEIQGKGAGAKWIKHEVSPKSYGHGIGSGDVNGDGRNDILTPKGWLEAPEDPRQTPWEHHADFDVDKAGFMFVHDVDLDGVNDIVTSMAHDYGVFWMKQTRGGDGSRSWEKKMIDDAWSQAHAMTMADLTGDGRPELITGKRLFAHNGHDPGGREPLGLYWYERIKTGKTWGWARHLIHYGGRVGTGMQISVADIDDDGDLDFAVAGKGGVFLFENQSGGSSSGKIDSLSR